MFRSDVALTVTVSGDWKGNQYNKFSLIGHSAAISGPKLTRGPLEKVENTLQRYIVKRSCTHSYGGNETTGNLSIFNYISLPTIEKY